MPLKQDELFRNKIFYTDIMPFRKRPFFTNIQDDRKVWSKFIISNQKFLLWRIESEGPYYIFNSSKLFGSKHKIINFYMFT